MKLCLGTVQFGMDYGVQGGRKPEYEKVEEILDYAVDHSITAFDSASAYGDAEAVVGRYIRRHAEKAGSVRVISKLAAGAFKEAPRDKWSRIALDHAGKSRKSLGIDRLEAYLFHDAAMINDPDAVRALAEVRRSGIARKVGVSVYTPDEAMKALEYDEIEVIQIPYNVFDHRLDHCGFFQETQKRKIDVYARSTLLQGLLTMDPDKLPVSMEFAKPYLKKYHGLCLRYSVSPLCASVNYVKQHKGIDFVVFGVDSLGQLKEYIEIWELDIEPGMIAELNVEFDEVEERLVNPVLWK